MMGEDRVLLKSKELEVVLRLPGCYTRSRYDHSGMIEQVSMGENRFLSREIIGDGEGLGGVGLAFCLEWDDTALYDQTLIADYFPLPGVGLLRKADTAAFQFTRDYQVVPFEHTIHVNPACVEIQSLPHLCQNTAFELRRRFRVSGNTLTIECELKNCGPSEISGTEFCHNFFCFNGKKIDSSYRLSFPYTLNPRMRRGQILLERDALRLGCFDGATASTAFWLNGYEGLSSHWMKLENTETQTGVLIEDDFPLARFYSWDNEYALCPETFKAFQLKPGESSCWRRTYSFYTLDSKT